MRPGSTVRKMMNFAFKTRHFVLKTRHFVFKMTNFADWEEHCVEVQIGGVNSGVGTHDGHDGPASGVAPDPSSAGAPTCSSIGDGVCDESRTGTIAKCPAGTDTVDCLGADCLVTTQAICTGLRAVSSPEDFNSDRDCMCCSPSTPTRSTARAGATVMAASQAHARAFVQLCSTLGGGGVTYRRS